MASPAMIRTPVPARALLMMPDACLVPFGVPARAGVCFLSYSQVVAAALFDLHGPSPAETGLSGWRMVRGEGGWASAG